MVAAMPDKTVTTAIIRPTPSHRWLALARLTSVSTSSTSAGASIQRANLVANRRRRLILARLWAATAGISGPFTTRASVWASFGLRADSNLAERWPVWGPALGRPPC